MAISERAKTPLRRMRKKITRISVVAENMVKIYR
jgi:hypothetical protein